MACDEDGRPDADPRDALTGSMLEERRAEVVMVRT